MLSHAMYTYVHTAGHTHAPPPPPPPPPSSSSSSPSLALANRRSHATRHSRAHAPHRATHALPPLNLSSRRSLEDPHDRPTARPQGRESWDKLLFMADAPRPRQHRLARARPYAAGRSCAARFRSGTEDATQPNGQRRATRRRGVRGRGRANWVHTARSPPDSLTHARTHARTRIYASVLVCAFAGVPCLDADWTGPHPFRSFVDSR